MRERKTATSAQIADVVLVDGHYYLITAKDAGELTGLLLRVGKGGWWVPTVTTARLECSSAVVFRPPPWPFLIGG